MRSVKASKEFVELKQRFNKKTIFDILRVDRQETPHSSFLCWLLDPKESHALQELPIRKFLHAVVTQYEQYQDCIKTIPLCQHVENKNPEHLLLFGTPNTKKQALLGTLKNMQYDIKESFFAREIALGETQERADIFALLNLKIEQTSLSLIILIENKVHSKENQSQKDQSQTVSYLEHLLDLDAMKNTIQNITGTDCIQENYFILPIYLYPCPDKELNNSFKNPDSDYPCQCHNFHLMNYQTLLDSVLHPSYIKAQKDNITESQYLLNEYMICLGNSLELSEKNGLVMAISPQERNLTMQLWENHKDNLLRVAEQLSNRTSTHNIDYYEILLYRHIFTIILSYEIAKEETPETLDVLKKSIVTTTSGVFYVKNKSDELVEYRAKLQKHNIAALGYVLLCQYLKDNPTQSIESIRELLITPANGSGIHNKWLSGFLIRQSDVDSMKRMWKTAGNTTNSACVCSYYYETITKENWSTKKGCPLSESGNNLVKLCYEGKEANKNLSQQVLNANTCPIHNKSNRDLWKERKINEKTKDISCFCIYDFMRNFYIKNFDWEETFSGTNTDFPPIKHNGENIYIARWWFTDNIRKLITLLQMHEYISEDPVKPPSKPLTVLSEIERM